MFYLTTVRTRATPAPPANQPITAGHDEDGVDYDDDAHLTDVAELECQLAGTAYKPTTGQASQGATTQVPGTPHEPAVAAASASVSDNAVVTVLIAFLNKMTDTQCCTRVENSRRGSRSRENRAVSKCLAGLVTVSTVFVWSRHSRECCPFEEYALSFRLERALHLALFTPVSFLLSLEKGTPGRL
ncbi:hypothetical protein FN846DRAFT_1002246 [Sphaerosporella brunnea]|uniref:Uncharacterized protein n=1 Tax=Sphaerosporella brunnea TaxID=1250544 RepID=A0A5J5F4N7_9PEZI|nr:hypothetical protein FN846DRAFT_1002246 [Sphaerosporella brunnea]